MMGVANDRMRNRELSLADIGALVVIVSGFGLIAIGKENQTVTVVIGMAAGFLFGKHTKKTR
jgi:hypothetical protein